MVHVVRCVLTRSACPVHFWRADQRTRTIRAIGNEPDDPSASLPRPSARLLTSGEPRVAARLARLRADAVRVWYANRFASCCGTDDPDQEFMAAHQAGGRPGRDHCADRPMGPALGHVGRERGDDAEREQPAGREGTGSRCRVAYMMTMLDA